MASCSMVQHILKTNDTSKLSCKDEVCNQIKVDASQPALLQYYLQVVGGPGSFIDSSMRYIRVCEKLVASMINIVKLQTASITDKIIKFMVPKFPNAICAVKYEFFESDCVTPLVAFKD